MTRSMGRGPNPSVLGRSAAALLAIAVVGTGCATSVGDIDRTQPDLISKDHFKGQWFVRETVVNVPVTSPASFIGEPGTLETVVWDVQQDWLVGYRAYELVPGLDGQAESDRAKPGVQPVTTGLGDGRDPDVYKGNPVVAYRISEHVDVQRGYNARTGEQTNVISENSSDRQWFERSFMRVDWSDNAVDSFNTEPRAFWPIFGQQSTMESFIPENEGGANAFRVELAEDGTAGYIDFTVRRTVVPSIMGCVAMWNSGFGDCTGEELQIRTSLLKVDPEREQEYVPLVYDDRRQGEFGYFRVERPTYDRKLGNTFTGLIQLAGRHDLWENSRDEAGEPLEYAIRTLRPLTYALSENYPENMLQVTNEIAQDYDTAMKRVAAATRGQEVSDLEEDLIADTGNDCLFCLDLNEDHHARNGDLRYNFIYWVDDLQAAGPLGFGPSSLNPETGRIVSASAYVYGASVDRYAESAKQIVELMIPENQGGLTEEELTSGQYFREAIRGDLNPIDPRATARFDQLSGDDLMREVLGDNGFKNLKHFEQVGVDGLAPAIPGLDSSRLRRIVGTELEARMIPEEWVRDADRGGSNYLKARADVMRRIAEAKGEVPPDFGPMGHLSVTNWFGGDALNELQQLEDLASRNNLWLAKFDDPTVAGLARQVMEMGLAGDELYQYLRERVFRAVMLHELGHTLGLRHNFAGSADALNYHDEYWDHRVKTIDHLSQYMEQELPVTQAFTRSNCSITGPMVRSDGMAAPGTDTIEGCEEQREAGMAEFQYSSIMDYGGRFNADIHGLGHYDIAALGSGYGDLVEVFGPGAMEGMDSGGERLGVNVRTAMLRANTVRNPILSQGLDNSIAIQSNRGRGLGHYANYPALLGGYQNIRDRQFIPRSEYLQNLEAANDLPAADRAMMPVKVPYLSCYDEFVDAVDTCHRWDQGADNYEIVQNNLNGYREYYVFNNFQRDRIGFDSFQVFLRTAQRYFLPLTNMYQHWFWGVAVTRLTPGRTPRGELGFIAARAGFDRMWNTLSTPDYGAHVYVPGDASQEGMYFPTGEEACPDVVGDVLVPADGVVVPTGGFTSMPECVDVARGLGRSFFSRYDSSGYDVYRRVLESGHFYDTMAAMIALQQSNASVVGIGSDVAADSRQFRIPYNLIFDTELNGLFSSIYNEADNGYGMHIVRAEGRPAEVLQRGVFGSMTNEQAAGWPIIAPGRTYTTRVQALVAGMNLLDGSLNAKFAKRGQISLLGSGEERTAPAGFEIVSVTDPATSRTYIAYRAIDGSEGPWYAADAVEQTRAALEASEEPLVDPPVRRAFGDLELVRLAYSIFGD